MDLSDVSIQRLRLVLCPLPQASRIPRYHQISRALSGSSIKKVYLRRKLLAAVEPSVPQGAQQAGMIG